MQRDAGVRLDAKTNGTDKGPKINQRSQHFNERKKNDRFHQTKKRVPKKIPLKMKRQATGRKYLQTRHLIKDLGPESVKNTYHSQEDKKEKKRKKKQFKNG